MRPEDFRILVRDYLIDLLNAPTLDKRAQICQEIADDPLMTTSVLMSLLEQIRPLRPPTVAPAQHEGLLQ